MQHQHQSQTSIHSEEFQKILESIGYNLIDCGDHWRAQALYRNGDNATALKIYKNTGIWMDFVESKGSQTFESLVRMTVGDKSEFSETLQKIRKSKTFITKPVERIEMEKIYPDEMLEKLFPHYNFYKERGISEATQKAFKVGLSGVGKMYRRMVFPVYNSDSQIIGFSGRSVDAGKIQNNIPKWKHIGKKSGWVYPAYVPDHECDEEILRTKTVILVESIGDALALYENGVKNVLVMFGLSVGGNIINYLSSKALDNVIVSTNYDAHSSENRGLIGAAKAYLKLSHFFDLDILSVKFPPNKANDFGEAHENSYNIKSWLDEEVDKPSQRKKLALFISQNKNQFSQKDIKKSEILNE